MSTGPWSLPHPHPVGSVHRRLFIVTRDWIPDWGGGKILRPLSVPTNSWNVFVLYAWNRNKKDDNSHHRFKKKLYLLLQLAIASRDVSKNKMTFKLNHHHISTLLHQWTGLKCNALILSYGPWKWTCLLLLLFSTFLKLRKYNLTNAQNYLGSINQICAIKPLLSGQSKDVVRMNIARQVGTLQKSINYGNEPLGSQNIDAQRHVAA